MKTINFFMFLFLAVGLLSCSEDNDCIEQTFYADSDGDGLGDPNNSKLDCSAPQGFVENALDNDDQQAAEALLRGTVADLFAPLTSDTGEPPAGPYTKFDLDTMTETQSETDWDIALRGTAILVNGGVSPGTADEPERTGDAAAYIAIGTMDDVVAVDPTLFAQDSPESLAIPAVSDSGWYNYNPATFTVTPLPGRILVFRTTEGRYAKIEILSYYQGAPADPNPFIDAGRYYTFNYVYQPNNGVTVFNEVSEL